MGRGSSPEPVPTADLLDGLPAEVWERTGRRSDGASFTVVSISRSMVHDPIHHLWDVTVSSP